MSINNKIEKRLLDPEIVNRIWFYVVQNAIKNYQQHNNGDDESSSIDYNSISVSKKCLIESLNEKKDDTSDDRVSKYIEQAIDEGLIRLLPQQLASSTSQPKSSSDDNGDSTTTTLTNGTTRIDDDYMICLPNESVCRPSYDWYCFECHRVSIDNDDEDDKRENISSSTLLKCQNCWRAYHRECVQKAFEFNNQMLNDKKDDQLISIHNGKTIMCPICSLVQLYSPYSVGSRQFDKFEFNKILTYTFNYFKGKASYVVTHSLYKLKKIFPSFKVVSQLLSSSNFISSICQSKIHATLTPINGVEIKDHSISSKDLITQLGVYYLSYKPVDLNEIENRLLANEYSSIGEYLGDCLSMKHMLGLAFCASADQTPNGQRRMKDALSRMLEATRYELKEMIGCVDCYRNSNQKENKLWFCRPCDPPHVLVFAKQKGYPYWPAKVIYPRYSDQIEACNQLDVRFFGSNHERSLIDKSNTKDINSSLIELNILKPQPSLERALQELRTYRELLEKNENIGKKRNLESNKKNDIKKRKGNGHQNEKCNSLKNGDMTKSSNSDDDDDLLDEEFMTEESSDCDKNVEQKKTKKDVDQHDSIMNENEDCDDATDIESATLKSDHEEDSGSKAQVISNSINSVPIKRGRGRPPKDMMSAYFKKKQSNLNKQKEKMMKRKELNNRVRKKRVIYSPNSRKDDQKLSNSLNRSSSNFLLKPNHSKRGPKPKNLSFPQPSSSVKISTSYKKPKNRLLSPKRNDHLHSHTSTTSKLDKDKSTSPSINKQPSCSYKYKMKKKEIEREREIIKARRKLQLNETPKHIPPMVATKSIPTVSPSKPILTQILEAKPIVNTSSLCTANIPHSPVPLSSSMVNGHHSQQAQYRYAAINENNNSPLMIKTDKSSAARNDPADNVPLETTNEDFKAPSSILKPLNSEGETDEDRIDEDANDNMDKPKDKTDDNSNVGGSQNQTTANNQQQTSLVNADDDDDEEPYLYDDEQLEDYINYYMEYEKEKQIQLQQQTRYNNYFIQQQQPPPMQQTEQIPYNNQLHELFPERNRIPNSHSATTIDGSLKPEKNSKTNGFMDTPEPLVKYIDFSTAQVYAPTKKNQNLVNNYLHQINTSKVPSFRSDYLAQYVLKKDEFEPEDLNIKKRGRPPKNSEQSSEFYGKAKCLLEKSYLQDSACDRACLTNNVKAFKKFREFLEYQSKNEISKLKRELEESKQQVNKLTNKNNELEDMIKQEKELNKLCNPDIVKQMEERYKREISQVKKKQWCVLCEAEANYFCCFKTNYCSPQCQLKHWQSGHKNECVRSQQNNRNRMKNNEQIQKQMNKKKTQNEKSLTTSGKETQTNDDKKND